MSDHNIMQALFNQQRIQIMHIGKHHDEFSNAYLYAWESGVYPALHDTDGSIPQKPHEPFADFFTTSKEKTLFLAKRLDDAWIKKERLIHMQANAPQKTKSTKRYKKQNNNG